MKQQIFSALRLIAFGLVLVVGLTVANATRSEPMSNPVAGNTIFPITVGSMDQVRQGSLAVGGFEATGNAEFDQQLFLQGMVHGGSATNQNSTIAFGGGSYSVDSVITGALDTVGRLRSTALANTEKSKVCADATGALILCDDMVIPTVTLDANPPSVVSGDPSTLTVTASNFDTITSCIITNFSGTNGPAPVMMTETSGGSMDWVGTRLRSNITDSTIFRVTCTGTLDGQPAAGVASALVTVTTNGGTGYYAHCFIADTKVTMADGTKKDIQSVKIGDVLKGDTTNNTVLGYHQPQLGDQKLYGFNGGKPFVTAEHPFLTTKGWKSIDPEKTKKENIGVVVTPLKVGDTLVTDKGLVKIERITSKSAAITTPLYNFILDGDHTYIADGYVVHNKQLCNSPYPLCPAGIPQQHCIDDNGQIIVTGQPGSCSLQCPNPGQPVSNGYCNQGGNAMCNAQGQVVCM